MDMESIAWKAFRLNGSIEAYLLHKGLVRIYDVGMNDGNNERTCNQTI